MKSKHEILEEIMMSSGQKFGDTITTITCARKAMDIYAAQAIADHEAEYSSWMEIWSKWVNTDVISEKTKGFAKTDVEFSLWLQANYYPPKEIPQGGGK